MENYGEILKINTGQEEALAGAAALISSGFQKSDVVVSENEALNMYKKLLVSNSSDPSVWQNIGVCLLMDDLYGDAFQFFLTALGKC